MEAYLEDGDSVGKAVADIHEIFHLGAALTNRGASPRTSVDSIARGTFNLIEGIRTADRYPRLVVTSSTSVYFSGPRYPYGSVACDETMPIAPSTPYGAAKRAAELFVENGVRNGWCRAAIVRPSDTAGTDEISAAQSVFGRRWFVEGARALYQSSPPGTADRVSAPVFAQIATLDVDTLFYLVDRWGNEPPIQISDASSVARFLIDQLDAVTIDSPSYINAVAAKTRPMGEFVRGVAEMLGRSEPVAIDDDVESGDRWRFGTISTVPRPIDVLTALTS